jgi:hypothetical protein
VTPEAFKPTNGNGFYFPVLSTWGSLSISSFIDFFASRRRRRQRSGFLAVKSSDFISDLRARIEVSAFNDLLRGSMDVGAISKKHHRRVS